MKKRIALLIASAVALNLFGCKPAPDTTSVPENQTGSNEKVSVWLPISITEYKADGSNDHKQITYTYTDKGLPLSVSTDEGIPEEIYNEDTDTYEYIMHAFDGLIDQKVEYVYNDQGDILYYTETSYTYVDGQLDSETTYSDHKVACEYRYNKNGKIEAVVWHSQNSDGTFNQEITTTYHYCYDDSGNLVEIYSEDATNNTYWKNDFRYDKDGHLVVSTIRPKEGSIQYQYKYDSQGRLTEVSTFHATCQTPLDDAHISQSSGAQPQNEFSQDATAQFTYDNNGNLISRKYYGSNGMLSASTECSYDASGKLSTVIYEGEKFVYVDDEKDADTSATTLVRDEYGNIVKELYPNGDYVAYEYQEFILSEKDAAKCKNIQLAQCHIDPMGLFTKRNYFTFAEGSGFLDYVPLVHTVLLPTDILSNRYYY